MTAQAGGWLQLSRLPIILTIRPLLRDGAYSTALQGCICASTMMIDGALLSSITLPFPSDMLYQPTQHSPAVMLGLCSVAFRLARFIAAHWCAVLVDVSNVFRCIVGCCCFECAVLCNAKFRSLLGWMERGSMSVGVRYVSLLCHEQPMTMVRTSGRGPWNEYGLG